MLHLRTLGVLETGALTVTGDALGTVLDSWQESERRARFRELLQQLDGVAPDDVIMSPDAARSRGLTSTVTFPRGNIAPEGSVIKSTALDPSLLDATGCYRHQGPARVFVRERDAIAALKAGSVNPGQVMIVICCGPLGSGMEETYQLTSALKHLPSGKNISLVTDARFSGVSTGACIGHVGPEALAGGPIGKLRDGDLIRIVIDRNRLEGAVDFVGESGHLITPEEGARILGARPFRTDLAPNPALPDDTRLWAALQQLSGGTWGGCVYDADQVVRLVNTRAGAE